MRYLIAVIDSATNTGRPDEMIHIDAFNDKLEADGHWVMAGGIMSPDTAKVIDNRATLLVPSAPNRTADQGSESLQPHQRP